MVHRVAGVYSVNGVQPNYTPDAYVHHDGDSVVWTYVNAVSDELIDQAFTRSFSHF